MIEEEDDEEVLKKGVTFKSILKNLLFIALVILGLIVIYFGFGPDQVSSWTIGFTLICLGSTLFQIQKKPSEPIRQTLTILKCNSCGLKKVRNYEKGDFVFKEKDKCEECGNLMEIIQIYSVRLKKATTTSEKKESKKQDLKIKI
jgi:hypothetical protein